MSSSTWTVLDESHAALRAVLAGLRPAELRLPTPCELWNVTQVLQHAAGDQLGYAAAITGEGWPAFDPFAPSGELVEHGFDGFVAFVEGTMQASAAAWGTVAADAADAPTPLPQGKMAGWLGAGACGLDAAVHAWDVAVATGRRRRCRTPSRSCCCRSRGRSSNRCGRMVPTPRPCRRPTRTGRR